MSVRIEQGRAGEACGLQLAAMAADSFERGSLIDQKPAPKKRKKRSTRRGKKKR